MPLESPISVLYDSNGTEIAVSQSQIVSGASQPGLMVAGSGSNGGAIFFRMANDGALFVTGTLATAAVATQSVAVISWSAAVTASVREIGARTTVVSSANGSVTNFTVLAANGTRKKASFYKEGGSTCYIKLGATASTTSYTVAIGNNGYFETPDGYTGQVDIIFSNNAGVVRVTEITYP
jgi:hypothetical protein